MKKCHEEGPVTVKKVRYKSCLKNHACKSGGRAFTCASCFSFFDQPKRKSSLKCAACECHRNFHFLEESAEDGCQEFLASGAEGTSAALTCAACGCHRNFHFQKEEFEVRYMECYKNHACKRGEHASDGCQEFVASGAEGTSAAFTCAVCECHRSFHRKKEFEVVLESAPPPNNAS